MFDKPNTQKLTRSILYNYHLQYFYSKKGDETQKN